KIGWHGRDEVSVVLLSIGLAELDAGNFGYRVGLVRGFEWAGQKDFLLHRLWCIPRINAGATQIQELGDFGLVSRFDDVGGDHKVVVEELGRSGGVCEDSTYSAGNEVDIFGRVGREPGLDR